MNSSDCAAENVKQPEALFFGADDRASLFGVYHSATNIKSNGAPPVSVLICSAYGFEEVAGHRGIRRLAIDCASNGLPCLRFDYLGCGNSLQDEFHDNQVANWLESIDRAATLLKQLSGAQRIVLIGFRLGASLAAIASRRRADVCGLIAVSPVVQGRRFLREQRLLSGAHEKRQCDSPSFVILEPNGFPMTASTHEAIEQINLLADTVQVEKALIIDSPDSASASTQWAMNVAAQGIDVEKLLIHGYEQLVDDPQTSIVPLNLFRTITNRLVAWRDTLRTRCTEIQPRQSSTTPENAAPLQISSSRLLAEPRYASTCGNCACALATAPVDSRLVVNESIVSINAGEQKLFGVLSQPNTGPAVSSIIMLNSGLVHNIGPNRLWVTLARCWASRGHRVLRFDFSGIGESPNREDQPTNLSYAKTAVSEITATLQYLKELENIDVHLVGLCSGGYQALRAAIDRLPLASSTLINPLAFDRADLGDELEESSIANYQILELTQQYRRRLATGEFWKKVVGGRLDLDTIGKVIRQRVSFSVQLTIQRLSRLLWMRQRNDIAAEIDSILRRGVKLNLIFASSDPGYELLRRKTGRDLNRLLDHESFSITLIPNADHTFTKAESRRSLSEALDRLLFLSSENQRGCSSKADSHE